MGTVVESNFHQLITLLKDKRLTSALQIMKSKMRLSGIHAILKYLQVGLCLRTALFPIKILALVIIKRAIAFKTFLK